MSQILVFEQPFETTDVAVISMLFIHVCQLLVSAPMVNKKVLKFLQHNIFRELVNIYL